MFSIEFKIDLIFILFYLLATQEHVCSGVKRFGAVNNTHFGFIDKGLDLK